MSRPAIRWFARALWVVTVAVTVATLVLLIRDASRYPGGDATDGFAFAALLAPGYATVGALIVSRRRNAIGRLEAIGGTFGVLSAPGGTRIEGRIPVDRVDTRYVPRP